MKYFTIISVLLLINISGCISKKYALLHNDTEDNISLSYTIMDMDKNIEVRPNESIIFIDMYTDKPQKDFSTDELGFYMPDNLFIIRRSEVIEFKKNQIRTILNEIWNAEKKKKKNSIVWTITDSLFIKK